MRKLVVLLCAAVMLLAFGCAPPVQRDAREDMGQRDFQRERPEGYVSWMSVGDGFNKSGRLKRPLLVYVANRDQCEVCTYLEKRIFTLPEVSERINNELVPVWVDTGAEAGPEIMQERDSHGINDLCVLRFVGPGGDRIRGMDEEASCINRRIGAEEFIRSLNVIREAY